MMQSVECDLTPKKSEQLTIDRGIKLSFGSAGGCRVQTNGKRSAEPPLTICFATENMVVDMELEAAKTAVFELMKEKESIETELRINNDVLARNRVSMDEPLVDSDGYPRNDIDVYRVRHARHKIICLRNDHKEVMRKIEEGLKKIHSMTGTETEETASTASSSQEEPTQYTDPFLRVNLVSSGSPAEQAKDVVRHRVQSSWFRIPAKMAEYSSNAAIEGIRAPDDNVEIRGYVDNAPGRQVVGPAGKRLNVLKFVVNNGAGKRVMCLAWEKEIDRIEPIVARNKILHIEAGQAKAIMNQRFNLGNASFELTIRGITEITDEGMRSEVPRPNVEVPIVEWEDIPDKEGENVSVVGWIKLVFKESRHFNNESSYGFGSITNGELKLEVRLTSLAGLPDGLQKGRKVKITGRVQFGSYLYVKLDSGADVTPVEGDLMDPARMLNITAQPAKRQRIE